VARGKQGRVKSKDKALERLLRELERQRPECVSGGGDRHYQVKCPDGKTIATISSTAHKGKRGMSNALADLARGGFQL
jgi:hypothetical protein